MAIFFSLFLLGLLPYVNTLLSGFVYDDNFQVVANPYVHSFRHLREIFTTTVWSFEGAAGVTNYFRPMMTLGYLLTYQIAGLVPFSFHLVNLVLNCVAVWLVFVLLRRFSGERVALVAAGLFALHPIHTEPVAWIAAVTDLQLTVFYLGAFLLYLRLAETDRRLRARIILCVVFLLALLSKEQAMTLPVMATIFEYFYRDDRSTTTAWEKLSRIGPLWAMAAFYLTIRTLILGGVASVLMRPNLSWHDTLLSSVSLLGGYIAKLIWPAHFAAFYVFHPSRHFIDAAVLLGAAGLVACAILFLLLWKRAHLLSFAFLLIFLPLGPVLNARWMPASVFAERYLYLPSVGFCWLLGWAAVKLWNAEGPALLRPLARAVPVLVAVVALLYAVRTVTRNRDWTSDEVLFRQALQSQSDASLVRSDLGAVYYNHGNLAQAEREWQEALSNGPSNVFAIDNMALLRQQQHRYLESLDYSWRALRGRPAYTMAHVNLAETLAAVGRDAEAEWQFRISTTLTPLSTRAHNGYGKFLFQRGRLEDARNEYERSVEADSTTDAYNQLGKIYFTWKDLPRAERAYRHALGVDNFDIDAHVGMGQVLEATGHPAEALREFEKGLEMDPSDAVAKAAAVRLRANSSAKPITQ
ncbi:MAG: tetratricopeptide repeat protein [Acidobacteriia bacterium]|nr:tetratricopeptide repeat protein [Terriglobia bacterium]